MKINSGNEIQAIHVYYSSQLNESSLFNSLLYGIEEEGVPSFLKEQRDSSSVELGYKAALDSSLGVGIGIGEDGQIILHNTKLPKEHPLFEIDYKEPFKQRVLGANAARLVKGIPFKSFEEIQEEVEIQEEETLSKEEIASIVAIVLKRLNEIS